MHWLGFWVALLVVCIAHAAVGVFGGVSWVDLYLAMALLVALLAPAADARLAALFVGLVQDTQTIGSFGVHGFALGVAGLLLARWREAVNQRSWWARWVVAAPAGGAAELLIVLHERFVQGLTAPSLPAMLLRAAVTALLASLIAAVLPEIPRALLRRGRDRYARPRW